MFNIKEAAEPEIKKAIENGLSHVNLYSKDLKTLMDLERYLEEAGFQCESVLHHNYYNDVSIKTKVWGWAD